MNSFIETILKKSIIEISAETGLGKTEVITATEAFSPEILVSIGITGMFQGYFMIQGTETNVFGLMKKMIIASGLTLEIADKKEIFTEAFKEFANQMSGRLIMKLSEDDINCNITPPTIISGDNINMELSGLPIYINLKAVFPDEEIHIEIGIKKS
ncbi:MAG: chemotaxis protein CheX [Spirochaetales bacterium]|nr:chemotaxis protein CheX [Spirochaetales bacterium]